MRRAALSRIVQSRLATFGIVFVVHGAVVFLWLGGPRMGGDSGWYADAADQLIASAFNYREFSQRVSSVPPPLFYFQFVLVTALCKMIFGASWAVAVVAVNLVAESLVAVQVVRLTSRLTRDTSATAFALALYLVASDIVLWTAYVLTDSIFLLLTFSLFYWTVRMFSAERESQGWRDWVVLAGLFVLTVTQRPVGLVLLPAVGWAVYQRSRPGRLPRPWPVFSLAGLVLLAMAAALGYVALLRDDALLSGPLASIAPLHHYAELYRDGSIVYSRPETYVSPPDSLMGYLLVSVLRFSYFFAFLAAGFSTSHTLLMVAFYLPAYIFAVVGLYALARRRATVDRGSEWVLALAAAFVGCFAFFHAHTEVDFDWRYRVPVLPHLVLLAAVGVSAVARMARRSPLAIDLVSERQDGQEQLPTRGPWHAR